MNKGKDGSSDTPFTVNPMVSVTLHMQPENTVKVTETPHLTRTAVAVEPTTKLKLLADVSEKVSAIHNRRTVERTTKKQHADMGADTVSGSLTMLLQDLTSGHGTTSIAMTRSAVESTVKPEHGANKSETTPATISVEQTTQVDRLVDGTYIISAIQTTSRTTTDLFAKSITDGIDAISDSPTRYAIETILRSEHANNGTDTSLITNNASDVGRTAQLKHTTRKIIDTTSVKHSTQTVDLTVQSECASNGTETTSGTVATTTVEQTILSEYVAYGTETTSGTDTTTVTAVEQTMQPAHADNITAITSVLNTTTAVEQHMQPEYAANGTDVASQLHTTNTVGPISQQEYVADGTEAIPVSKSTHTIQPTMQSNNVANGTQIMFVTHATRSIDTFMLPDHVGNVSETTTLALTASTVKLSVKPEHHQNRTEPTSIVDTTRVLDVHTQNASTDIQFIFTPAIAEHQIEQPEVIRGTTPGVILQENVATTSTPTMGGPTTSSGDTTTSSGNTFTTAAKPTPNMSTTRKVMAQFIYTPDARAIVSSFSPTRRVESTRQPDKASLTNTAITESTSRPEPVRRTPGTIATITITVNPIVRRVDASAAEQTTSSYSEWMTQSEDTSTERTTYHAIPTRRMIKLNTKSVSAYVTSSTTHTTPITRHLEQTTGPRVSTVSSINGNVDPTTTNNNLTTELRGSSLGGEGYINQASTTVEFTEPPYYVHTANNAITDTATLSMGTSTTENEGASTSETHTSGVETTSTGDQISTSHTTTSAG